jgi:outer membrane protein OmpA-like peptidoglycan-associated protein
MRRSYRYIAGASAVALAAVTAAQLARNDPQPQGEKAVAALSAPPSTAATDAPAFVADAAPMPEPTASGADPAEVAARIDDLITRLADREAELAAITASLAERDASLDTLTATLTLREGEIQALRDELATLRERYAFDLELEAIKGRGTPVEDAAPAVLAAAEGPAAAAPSVLALTQIHFEMGSSSLTPGGQVHAAAAAVMLSEMPVVRVRLLGYADRTGRADHNRALSVARARAVADFLVRSGVAAEILEAAGMGEDDLPVATGPGVAEPLNRTVAIVAIPRPTS